MLKRSLLVAAALLLSLPAQAQDPGGISSSALSRCAGKVGGETRQVDPAFGIIMLDGMPWVTIERTEEQIGTLAIATTVTSLGAYRRRNGSTAPFRFTCVLDDKGQAVMFHSSAPLPGVGDELAPAKWVEGMVTYREKMALPRGAELRVQLLDTAASPPEIVAEQVVRSGWAVPIPFALRVPVQTRLDGRTLVVTARLVMGREVLFQLGAPHALPGEEWRKPSNLVLDQATASNR